MVRRRSLTLLLAISVVIALVAGSVSCAATPATPTPATPAAPAAAPDKIRFGSVLSLTGILSAAAQAVEVPARKYWLDHVNKEGGIYVPQYGKKIPVDIITYDDKSDLGTSVQLLEKLITVDKVDLTLPPNGTAQHVAQAPIANKYKQPWMTCTSTGSMKFKEDPASLPYTFFESAFPDDLMKDFADEMQSMGVKSVAIMYVDQELGLNYKDQLVPLLPKVGIEAKMLEGFPVDLTDFSALLKKAQATGADGLITMGYPPCTFAVPKQAATIGYNPKMCWQLIGVVMQPFIKMYGAKGMEGIMSLSGWNKDVSPAAGKFYDSWMAFMGYEPQWSDTYCVATYEVLEQAIAKVGYADLKKLRDEIANDTFETAYTTVKCNGTQFNKNWPASGSQWQGGKHVAVWPKEKAQAPILYPKPNWPPMN